MNDNDRKIDRTDESEHREKSGNRRWWRPRELERTLIEILVLLGTAISGYDYLVFKMGLGA